MRRGKNPAVSRNVETEEAPDLPAHVSVAIVGTGFSGIGAAMRLSKAGQRDFVLLERAGDVGGTWRDNTYPGAQCDVPSRQYSFSFRARHRWSTRFGTQPEILDYLRSCAGAADLWPKIHLHTALLAADWDEVASRWRITTNRGVVTASMLVMGTGYLSEPRIPDFPGLDTFTGAVFHSAQWDHKQDLAGSSVAVVGTGASAVQFIPHLQREVASLVVVQRTPAWVFARKDRRIGPIAQTAVRWIPLAARAVHGFLGWAADRVWWSMVENPKRQNLLAKGALAHLRKAVSDPELEAKLTPNYRAGCKRLLISDDYYPALAQDNVEVVVGEVVAVEPAGIRTSDGALRPVDAIVLGTGFRVTDNPTFDLVRGRDGRSLAQTWADGGARAYLGTSVRGFPNLFLLLGPNANSPISAVEMIECQLRFVVGAVRHLARRGLRRFEVRAEVEQAWHERMTTAGADRPWRQCANYNLDSAGRSTVLWPEKIKRFRRATRRFRASEFDLA
ncbi:MAG: flavin-containing monooxygenase [Sporichthyaceae bacterium]